MATNENSSTKLILKNTLFLYARQLITLAVSLYTSRVTLDVLGVENYGLYNVIAGVVVLLTIVNNSMVAATQRFLTYEIGKGDNIQINRTFSMGMTAHLFICLLVLIVGESLGLYYINNYLVVPEGREIAAFWVYQISLFSILVNIVRSPYQASIISYERMNFFAKISIVEVLIKLLIVYLLILVDFDKLILYATLHMVATLIITMAYRRYCQNNFSICHYSSYIDKTYFKKLLGYLGWNVVGAFSTLGTQQAGNMIINRFAGVAFNAAYGTANQVSAAVGSFVSNFQTAFTPQIVKLYAQEEKERMYSLMNRSALLSFYLLFLLVTPILFNIDFVLGLWLKKVPDFTGIFCIWIFLTNFIDALQAPFWIAIGATGNIRGYQIWQSTLWFMTIPALYYCLYIGLPPYSVVIVRFVIALICAFIRTLQAKYQVGVSLRNYIYYVLARIAVVSTLYIIPIYYLLQNWAIDNFISFVLFYLTSFVYIIMLVYTIGIGKAEREFVKHFIKQKIKLR